jgi:agmatine deiminase
MTNTPLSQGYRFPAEWEPHRATWLSYPHNNDSWPGKIHTIFPFYHQFIKELTLGEEVHINVLDDKMQQSATEGLLAIGTDMSKVSFHKHLTNDAWCRDHGPAFLVHKKDPSKKLIVKWDYNAWGNKYPHELDNEIPLLIAKYRGLDVVRPGIVMEGGSVDFNGKGTVLSTTACLLHENRNPHLSQMQIEEYLCQYYGVENVLWLDDGIDGDDTNGHVDDITRFVNEDTVITMVEPNKRDDNHEPLAQNLKLLSQMRLQNGKQLNIVEIPMPERVEYEEQRLPASYSNFYIANHSVIVPTFQCPQDDVALDILSKCFKDRKVIGIDSTEIIWGLGSFHCLSQQEPV